MKISKTAVLTAWSALMIAWLWLMFVSAADKNLYVDPNNAIQHFEKVRIVPIESGDNSMADIVKKWNLFWIETDYNFALSRSWTDANQISGNTMWSSILGWIVNKILWGIYNGILWWKNNKITTGNNNGILWWENNEIGGNYSVIFWWKGNEIWWSWSYSAIVGGSGNKINGSYSVVVWRNNNTAKWYNSVAMWSGSKLNATSSFLWTDGIYSGNFTTNHVFAVLWDKGMVINATGAHDLAQLTISGVLVVYDDKNAPKCTPETKWVLKVVTGDNSTTNQECFCSCDGSWRNVLHEWSNCVELCKDDDLKESPQCGNVVEDCNSPYHYTWGSEWACVKGQLIRWTWAFFVSSTREWTGLINYINRSCQVAWEITWCQKKLEGDSCPNRFTDYKCLWEKEEHWLTKDHIKPRDSATRWEYSVTWYDNNEPCKYICDQWSHWDSRKEKCIPNDCADLTDPNADWNNNNLPTVDGKDPEYNPESNEACTYHCVEGYDYDYSRRLCRALACEDFNIPNATQNSRDGYPTQFDQAYEYQAASDDNEPCTYHCADGFGYKEWECKPLACVGTLPDNTELVHPTLKPTDPDTRIFYDPDSKLACAYMCRKNYIRSGDNCVLDLKNCSVGLRESTTSTSAKTLSSSYTVSNLWSSNVWECKYTNDGTVKLFAEECDDKVQSFNTKLGSLTMNQWYKFKWWYVDGVLKSSDLNNWLNLNCGDMADLKWDCDEENGYERYNGQCVEKTLWACTGSVPDNAVLVGLGEERVPALTNRLVYENESAAKNHYCAYICKDGFDPVNFNGIYSCVNSETNEVSCNNKKWYINGEDSDGNITCIGLSNCIQNNEILKDVPSNGKSQWEYLNYRPVWWNNDLLWKCTDWTPTQNRCEYQCKDSYGCQDGVCIPYYCPSINRLNLYNYWWYFTTDVENQPKGVGADHWTYVSSKANVPNKNGCYFWCKSDSFYGRTRYREDGDVYWCIQRKCPNKPSYLSDLINAGLASVTATNPKWSEWYNAEGNYVNDDDWTYNKNPWNANWCYYACTWENVKEVTAEIDWKIVTSCQAGTCPSINRSNLYNYWWYFTTDVETESKGAGADYWTYVSSKANVPNKNWCYFWCKSNSFYGRTRYREDGDVYWCLQRKCPGMPIYLVNLINAGLASVTSENPEWSEWYNAEGNYVNDDDWTYNKNPWNAKWCYYACTWENVREVTAEINWKTVTLCTKDICLLPTMQNLYNYDLDFTTDVEKKPVQIEWKERNDSNDRWIYVPWEANVPNENWCYFWCKSNSFYGRTRFYKSDGDVYWCLQRKCPNKPSYLSDLISAGLASVTATNPKWSGWYNAEGNYVNDDDWTYSKDPWTAKWCYYACNTSKNYYPYIKEDGNIGCKLVPNWWQSTSCSCDWIWWCSPGTNGYLCEKEIKQNGYICKEQQPDGTRTETPICSGEGTWWGWTTWWNLTTVCDGICETCFYNDNYGEACTPGSVPTDIESCTDSRISGYVLNGGAWDMVSLIDGSNMCIKCVGWTTWHGDPDYKCK